MPHSEVQTRNDPIFVEYFDPGDVSQADDLRAIAEWIDEDPDSLYTVHQVLMWRGPVDVAALQFGHHELYYSIDIVSAMER